MNLTDALVKQFGLMGKQLLICFRSRWSMNGRWQLKCMYLGIYFNIATEFRIFHKSLVSRELQETFRVSFQQLTVS